MSATIDNIQRVRDEKKGLIEKAYTEDLDYIQSRPSGEHETLNTWSLNFGNTSAENLKLKYGLLKQGKITVNDFVKFRQNLSDSVEKIYTVNGQLQEAFKKVNDRTKAGENQELERATKVLLEKYGALENTLPYVNSLTGSVAIGLTEIAKDAEGKEVRKLRQGEDSYLTPQQLQAAAMQEFNAYDEQDDLNKWVESHGGVQRDMREIGGERLAGLITSVTDVTSESILEKARNLPEGSKLSDAEMKELEKYVKTFNQGETDYINGILANPFNALALATDRIKINPKTNQPYNIVFNKDDQKTSNDLYVEKTSVGEFKPIFDDTEIGKGQKDQLRDFLKNQLRVKYDRKSEMQPYNEPTPPRPQAIQQTAAQSERFSGIEDVQGSARWIGQLYSGNNTVKQNALEILRKEPGVVDARFVEEDGVPALEIINSLGKRGTIKITDKLSVAQFGNAVASSIYTDTENRKVLNRHQNKFDEAITAQHSTFNPMNMNDKPDQYWTAREVEEEDPYALFVKENEKTKDNPKGFWGKDFLDLPAENVTTKLNAILPKYGKFKAKNTTGVYSQVIVEKFDDAGNVIEFAKIQPNWKGINAKRRDAQMKLLEDFLQSNIGSGVGGKYRISGE
jgi:hypothetical protein